MLSRACNRWGVGRLLQGIAEEYSIDGGWLQDYRKTSYKIDNDWQPVKYTEAFHIVRNEPKGMPAYYSEIMKSLQKC